MELGSLSFLHDYKNLQEAITLLLNCSSSRIKKSGIEKRRLNYEVRKRDRVTLPLNLLNYNHISPNYEGVPPQIIFEDNEFLVLDKPVKIHTHPLSYEEHDNLLSFLRSINMFAPLLVNTNAYDRGALYRLDYETSGVLIFAKTDELYDRVRLNFHKLMKEKQYLVAVSGEWNVSDEKITQMFNPSEKKGSTVVATSEISDEGEIGEMGVMCLLKTSKHSLLAVDLKSGLRHQIRASLKSLGFPIVGDAHYGGESAERLMLHAFSYELIWENQRRVFVSQIPELFKLLFKLKSDEMLHDLIRSVNIH